MYIGSKVYQYDYIERREVAGEVVADRYVYSAAHDNDVSVIDVRWDNGVTTSHGIDKLARVDGRDGYLLVD